MYTLIPRATLKIIKRGTAKNSFRKLNWNTKIYLINQKEVRKARTKAQKN